MAFSRWAAFGSGLAAALAMIGCGGSSQPFGSTTAIAPAAFPLSATVTPDRQKSWMMPNARKATSLLYISNTGTSDVTVYTYLNGHGLLLVGKLTGFELPTGMCTDTSGNVWISDYSAEKLYEYAHGGSKPIETIRQHSGRPYDCSVDPKTGNLAVANQLPNHRYYSSGVVTVYPKGSTQGTTYRPPDGFSDVDFLAYDNQSNLFVDGTVYYYGDPALFELAKGASALTQLTLSGATLYQPGAISWLGPTLLLGDRDFQNQGTSGAYRVFVSGSVATVVGTLPFAGTQEAYGSWRRATNVIVPDHPADTVRIYALKDGSLVSKLTDSVSLPFGATVSSVPK